MYLKVENIMLAIQKYILANGLEKAILEFNLKTRIYSDKILLKYDQLVSPTLMANKEVQECRGLILEKGSWKVMSLAFTKFFNSEEGNAHKIDWDTAHVLEKLDGCLDEETIITTNDGEKTIKEICETKFSGKVLSYDIEKNEIVFDEIVAHSVKNNINNWFKIELEDGESIKLTGNHRVWLPKLSCYRNVDELTEDDEFLMITK